MSTQACTDRIEEWLQTQRTTLWADWDITDPEDRRCAAAWFAAQLERFTEWDTWTLEDSRGDCGTERPKDRETTTYGDIAPYLPPRMPTLPPPPADAADILRKMGL